MNDVAFAVTVCVNNPTPAISGNGAAIAPRPASSTELVSDDLPIFHWRPVMPQIASRMRTIQVRLSRNPRWQKQGGWEVFEADGVNPVYCGDRGRESAL